MKVISSKRVSDSCSDNRKSKSGPADGNLKWLGLSVIAFVLVVTGAVAQAQSNFFQGKSVRVIHGGQPGDLYDLWTRHIATYLGKYISGNPSIMVQDMPGATAAIAAYRYIKKLFL